MSDQTQQLAHELRGLIAEARSLVEVMRAGSGNQPPASVSPYLADQVLSQIAANRWRNDQLAKLTPEQRRETVAKLLDPSLSAISVFRWLNEQVDTPISRSGFYRFAGLVRKALNQLHEFRPAKASPAPSIGTPGDDLFDFGPVTPAVVEAVDAMLESKSKNRLLLLPRPILHGACQRIADAQEDAGNPRRATNAARYWLSLQLGTKVNNAAWACLVTLFEKHYAGVRPGQTRADSRRSADSCADHTPFEGPANADKSHSERR